MLDCVRCFCYSGEGKGVFCSWEQDDKCGSPLISKTTPTFGMAGLWRGGGDMMAKGKGDGIEEVAGQEVEGKGRFAGLGPWGTECAWRRGDYNHAGAVDPVLFAGRGDGWRHSSAAAPPPSFKNQALFLLL